MDQKKTSSGLRCGAVWRHPLRVFSLEAEEIDKESRHTEERGDKGRRIGGKVGDGSKEGTYCTRASQACTW